jgi:3-phenylpropionate/trans-cinnamate dioxygenase ferredoxin subunit
MTGWIAAVPLDDLEDEDVVGWSHGGRDYALCLDDHGQPHCLDADCPADGAALAGGLVEGRMIECPLGCRYDLRSGQGDNGERIGLYPARIGDAAVEVSFG